MARQVSVEPFPPGEYIAAAMEGKGWTQDVLASVMGRTRQHVNRLLQGRTAVTAATAHELAAAFGTSAEVWMNLQLSYELALAAKETREIEKRAELFSRFPIRDMQKRGWLPRSKDTSKLEASLCDFFHIDTASDTPLLAVAARKSTPYTEDSGAHLAWYAKVRNLAESAPATKYDEKNVDAGLRELRVLMAYPEDARRIPSVLGDMGIRLVIVQHLPKTKIDGVAMWLDENSPAIGLSLRYDRMDNLWFTLMHELSHIRHRDESGVDDAETLMGGDQLPAIEQRANAEAADSLMPNDRLESFISRVKPLYYQKKVVQFAQACHVHPAIVVGQLQRRKELDYSQLRKMQVKVRDEMVGQAVTDGWGNAIGEQNDG